jgi:hypothetical protein
MYDRGVQKHCIKQTALEAHGKKCAVRDSEMFLNKIQRHCGMAVIRNH